MVVTCSLRSGPYGQGKGLGQTHAPSQVGHRCSALWPLLPGANVRSTAIRAGSPYFEVNHPLDFKNVGNKLKFKTLCRLHYLRPKNPSKKKKCFQTECIKYIHIHSYRHFIDMHASNVYLHLHLKIHAHSSMTGGGGRKWRVHLVIASNYLREGSVGTLPVFMSHFCNM